MVGWTPALELRLHQGRELHTQPLRQSVLSQWLSSVSSVRRRVGGLAVLQSAREWAKNEEGLTTGSLEQPCPLSTTPLWNLALCGSLA